ncbi:MAG: YihA family ribosome biogenesis GTP-binding protein [Nevskiaceae bacterium]|nr:MAG: YihA family ribosome biogenesis GTP-binding protein [Nevskiaceae bacterium]TBR72604.1 MAG: YihA family ribosome biogenesis GTP-binding protein [Nevskiaceae bacterium]
MTDKPHSTTPAQPAANPLRGACFLRSAAKLAQLPPDAIPEVAFAGRSNAGKSSALNRLCDQRGLARVSNTPGRTQLINLFALTDETRLVDLPGYGFAKAPPDTRRTWEALVGQYVAQRRNLIGLVVLMDVRRPLQPLDVQMLEWAHAHVRPVHILLTKADKLSRSAALRALENTRNSLAARPGEASAQLFSSLSGQGLEQARDQIDAWLHPPSTS